MHYYYFSKTLEWRRNTQKNWMTKTQRKKFMKRKYFTILSTATLKSTKMTDLQSILSTYTNWEMFRRQMETTWKMKLFLALGETKIRDRINGNLNVKWKSGIEWTWSYWSTFFSNSVNGFRISQIMEYSTEYIQS